MAKPERSVPMLSDAEEARLQASISKNLDSREPTPDMLARMRPASEVVPPMLYAALIRPRGRPKADETKMEVKRRLNRAAVATFKAGGAGWQTRMNDALVRAAADLK